MWFGRWIDIYKKKTVRPNTLREYTHIYNKNISPILGSRNINSFAKSDIQFLIDEVADNNYKYERQNKIKVILNDMFSRAIEDDLMIKNPAKGIKLRADKEIKAFALTAEQQTEFLEASKGTFYDNLYNVAVNTGLRQENYLHLHKKIYTLTKDTLMSTKRLYIKNTLMMIVRLFTLNHPRLNRVTDMYLSILNVVNILKGSWN